MFVTHALLSGRGARELAAAEDRRHRRHRQGPDRPAAHAERRDGPEVSSHCSPKRSRTSSPTTRLGDLRRREPALLAASARLLRLQRRPSLVVEPEVEWATTEIKQPAQRALEQGLCGAASGQRVVLLARPARGSSQKGICRLSIVRALADRPRPRRREGDEPAGVRSTRWPVANRGRRCSCCSRSGFAAYVLWRIVQAFAEREDGDEAKERARSGASARATSAVRRSTLAHLFDDRDRRGLRRRAVAEPEGAPARRATVLDWPAGRWLVAIGGVIVAGVGVWNLYPGLAPKFEDNWRTGEMSATQRRWASRVGLAGHVARFVVFALIGVFVDEGRERLRPEGGDPPRRRAPEARARCLRALAAGFTAAGLLCYGAFCLADARYRDVSAG